MDQQRAKRTVTEVLVPYFTGATEAVRTDLLSSPERIVDQLLGRTHTATPSNKPRPQQSPASRPCGWRGLPIVRTFFQSRHHAVACPSPATAPSRIFCQFSRLNQALPAPGLYVGGSWQRLWVSPLSVELRYWGQLPGQWQELHWSVRLTYGDGTAGEAGFVDRKQPDGSHCRLHCFPDGSLASNDNYPHSKLNHDVFRTLLATMLFLESSPSAIDIVQTLFPAERCAETLTADPANLITLPLSQPIRLALPSKRERAKAVLHILPEVKTAVG